MMVYVTASPVDIATEREMADVRRRLRRREQMARTVLQQCRPGAPMHQLAQAVEDGWPGTPPIEATKIAVVAERIRAEERETVRRIPVAEYLKEHPMGEMQEQIRDVTQALLEADPDGDRREQHAEVLRQTGAQLKFGSWQTTYLYPVRKELRGETDPSSFVLLPPVDPKPDPSPPPLPPPSEDVATISTRNGEWYRVGRGGDYLDASGNNGTWEVSIHISGLGSGDVMEVTKLIQPLILDFGP